MAPPALTFVMMIATGVGVAAALLAWRERPEPGASPLVALFAGQVWWCVFFVFELRASTLAAKTLYSDVQWVGVVVIPVAWLLFALEYTGRDRYVRPRYVAALAVVPAVTVVLALTGGYHDLLYVDSRLVHEGGFAVLKRTGGTWYWVVASYTYLLGLGGSLPLVGLVRSDALPFRGQSVALLVAASAPWVGNALFLLGAIPIPGFDPTPVTFVVSGVACLGAITRFRLLGTSPSPNRRARRLVFERMREGAVVVDRHDYVVDMNERACAVLGVDAREALGRPAPSVIPDYGLLPAEGRATRHLSVGAGAGDRQYDATVTAIDDYHGRPLGRVISFHDVSEHLRRQQRLEVLNRVLRHNIRTETNIIYGNADLMTAEDDRVETVKEGAMRIEAISDKARDVIDIFERGRRAEGSAAFVPTLEECVAAVRERHPGVAIDVDAAVDSARVSPVVEPVLANVVENAAEHNDAADPRVDVGAVREGDRVRVRVADNGPGIADHERAVLERGTETPLEHGSGLGLWLIAWGTDLADGDLTIADGDPTGTVVTVTVPTVPDGRRDERAGANTNTDTGSGVGGDRSSNADGAAVGSAGASGARGTARPAGNEVEGLNGDARANRGAEQGE